MFASLPHYSYRDDVDIEVRIEYMVAGVEDECSEKHAGSSLRK